MYCIWQEVLSFADTDTEISETNYLTVWSRLCQEASRKNEWEKNIKYAKMHNFLAFFSTFPPKYLIEILDTEAM